MIFSGLAAGAKAIGLRFTISGILPFALLGWFAFGLASVENAGPKESLLKALNASLHSLGPAGWALMIVGSFVFAVITQPFQIAVVRLLEGYWGASVASDHLRAICAEFQRRRRHYLHTRR